MASFDKHTLQHLKKLCRIELSEEEEADILQSLSRILDYVKQFDEISTDNVPPCNYVLRNMAKNPLRDDVPQETLARETFLANAPDQIAGMIRIPPVLKP